MSILIVTIELDADHRISPAEGGDGHDAEKLQETTKFTAKIVDNPFNGPTPRDLTCMFNHLRCETQLIMNGKLIPKANEV